VRRSYAAFVFLGGVAHQSLACESRTKSGVKAPHSKGCAAVCVGVRRLKKRLEEEDAKLRERRAKEVSP
jgi:hypothetical protein